MNRIAMVILSVFFSTAVLSENIAIVGGQVHTMSSQGTLKSATVLVKNGKIERVIDGVERPAGYEVIDASGKVVTPGFIGAMTSLGLVEVSSSSGVVDASVEKSPVTNSGAALDVSYAINPDSSLIAITRLEGMTSAATSIMGSDYMFDGMGAVISLSDNAPLVKARAFMNVDVGSNGAEVAGGSRAALWVALEQMFAEAKGVSNVLSPEKGWYGMNTRSDVASLKQVLNGSVPLFMRADRAADIRQVIEFKYRHPTVRVVLVHGVEAWREADALSKANIPVIIDPEYNLPGGFDQMGATLANAARLHAAGVKVAIGMDTHNIRLAAQHAGNAVANGLPHEAGIASLTTVPAEILGVENTLGVLKNGAVADIVVWSGDPLEVTEAAEVVISNGKVMQMESRQTKLRDRYLLLQQTGAEKPSHYYRELN